MIGPHDKVSFVRSGRRYYRFVRFIINDCDNERIMVEFYGKTIGIPADQCCKENLSPVRRTE